MNTWTKRRMWYLSGGMTKFGKDEFRESNNWRREVKSMIEDITDRNILCFNPNDHYNCADDPSSFTDREAMDLDIYKLRQSELVIYCNNDPFSRGSMIELGIAYQMDIPIIVLNNTKQELHPWVRDMARKVFESTLDMFMYLKEHYMCMD